MKITINEVVSTVMGVDLNQITDDTSPDNLAEWTSIKHMNLILALEQAFDVSFEPKDIVEMLNVSLIREILNEKLHC